MAPQFALGFDFGTESLRIVVVDTSNGGIAGESVAPYEHGVMDRTFHRTGEALPPDFALQDPDDYLNALKSALPEAMKEAHAAANQIAGIGVDFTACTPLPVKGDGTPLCRLPEFEGEPHAMVKLWKHHGANKEASEINDLARERGETFLQRYGGTTSSEWLFPKLLETKRKAPAVYEATDRFMEASDWVVLQLTGKESRGACAAGYKGMWHDGEGYPSDDFLESLEGGFSGATRLLARSFVPAGMPAGEVTLDAASEFGLRPGIPVSAAIIDAHAAVPGCGVASSGKMVIILGTSSCHMLMDEREVPVQGIQGVVREGILPGYYGYEAGQAATGDIFAWFVRSFFESEEYGRAFQRLHTEAAALKPGAHGLVALDWWNGNRSILINPELTGLMAGMTLNTRPAEIFRSLIEATGFGTRIIIDNFTAQGVPVDEVIVCGGLAEKNPLLLQIYADITNRPLAKAASAQTCALGAAICGAVVAGRSRGGHDDFGDAVEKMAPEPSDSFKPQKKASAIYDRMFGIYKELHDLFGRSGSMLMERLRTLKTEG